MSFTATVLQVMIASPGDVSSHRDAIERTVHEWNGRRAPSSGVALLPRRWETDAVPLLDSQGGGQSVINTQLVDECDIVFAVFHTRLGQPTAIAASGTAEEIQRANDAGTPVHVYFSEEPIPASVNLGEMAALRAFREELQARGLYGTFTDEGDLTRQVRRDLEHDVEKATTSPPRRVTSEVTWAEPGPVAVALDVSEEAVAGWRSEAETRFQAILDFRSGADEYPPYFASNMRTDWPQFRADVNSYLRASDELFGLEARALLVDADPGAAKVRVRNTDQDQALVSVQLRIIAPEGVEIHDGPEWPPLPAVPRPQSPHESIMAFAGAGLDRSNVRALTNLTIDRDINGRWVAVWNLAALHPDESLTMSVPSFVSVQPMLAGTTIQVDWRLTSTSRQGIATGTLPLRCKGTVSITDVLTRTLPE